MSPRKSSTLDPPAVRTSGDVAREIGAAQQHIAQLTREREQAGADEADAKEALKHAHADVRLNGADATIVTALKAKAAAAVETRAEIDDTLAALDERVQMLEVERAHLADAEDAAAREAQRQRVAAVATKLDDMVEQQVIPALATFADELLTLNPHNGGHAILDQVIVSLSGHLIRQLPGAIQHKGLRELTDWALKHHEVMTFTKLVDYNHKRGLLQDR